MTKSRAIAFGICLALALPRESSAWGLRAHRWIVERAIETLPEPLRGAYREHRRELANDAVAPDVLLRKRDGAREERRHYVRLENYGDGVAALAGSSRAEAERRFGKRTVRTAGLLPWVIVDHATGIERAFRRGDWKTALRTSGFGAHYVADGFMPLHTTANFDGQKSSAGPGLHEALERDVVDRNLGAIGARLESKIEPASTTPFTQGRVMALLRDVHRDLGVLVDAHVASARRGTVDSAPYLAELERRTEPVLERRLADAVHAVASLWLSAWTAAGRPAPPRALK